MPPEVKEVFERNVSSGEHHRVFVIDGQRYSDERCNLDAARKAGHLQEVLEGAISEGVNYCGHCCKGYLNVSDEPVFDDPNT